MDETEKLPEAMVINFQLSEEETWRWHERSPAAARWRATVKRTARAMSRGCGLPVEVHSCLDHVDGYAEMRTTVLWRLAANLDSAG